MSCVYIYNKQRYSKEAILDAINKNQVTLGNIAEARKNIRKLLNMNDSEIELVHGLINENAVGLFQADGKILLSDSFVQGDEYHEAFHRVFQMMLSPRQQSQLLKEYLNREGAKKAIENKKKLYPDLSQEALIEELLADEFMMYQLADGNYIVPKPIQNFFQKLLNFLKKILGLKNINELYDSIRAGEYKAASVTNYNTRAAETRVVIGEGSDSAMFSTEQKNEIIDDIIARMLTLVYDEVSESGSFEDVDLTKSFEDALGSFESDFEAKYNADPDKLFEFYIGKDKAGNNIVENYTYDDVLAFILLDIYADEKDENDRYIVKQNSVILNAIAAQLKYIGINLQFKSIEKENNGELDVEETLDEVDNSNVANDYAFMKASWETDPNENITKTMKMFASLIPSSEQSEIFGLYKTQPYTKVTSTLYKLLKHASYSWDSVSEILNRHVDKIPWLQDVLDRLNTEDADKIGYKKSDKLRNQFITSFVKVSYPMDKVKLEDKNVQVYSLDETSTQENLVREVKFYLIKNFSDEAGMRRLKGILRSNENVISRFYNVFGVQLSEDMLQESIYDSNHNSKSLQEVASNILGYVLSAIETNNVSDIENIVAKKHELTYEKRGKTYTEDFAILTNLRKVLNVANKYNPDQEVVLLDHNKNRLYGYTLHTYQKQLESFINDAIEKTIDMQEYESNPELYDHDIVSYKLHKRLQDLQTKIPFFVNDPFNFYINDRGLYDTSSPLFRRWIGEGIKYQIGLYTGVETNIGTDSKDLAPADIIASVFRFQEQYSNIFLSNKHGDRGILFTGKFEGKGHYIPENITDTDVKRYLATLLKDELRIVNKEGYDVFKDMGKKELKLFSYLNLTPEQIKQESSLSEASLLNKYDSKIQSYIDNVKKEFKDYMVDSGFAVKNNDGSYIFKTYSYTTKNNSVIKIPYFLTPEQHNKVKDLPISHLIEQVALKYMMAYNEDLRAFSGYVGEYKDMPTLFKRIQSLSSSGTPLVSDSKTNMRVVQMNRADSFTIELDGIVYEKYYGESRVQGKAKGIIKEVVLKGPRVDYNQEYESDVPYDGDIQFKIFYDGFIKDGLTPEQASERAQEYVDNFKEYEEADGVTYTNMFFFREYIDSLGLWNDNYENTFQIELATLLQNTLNPKIYYNPDKPNLVFAKPMEGYVNVRAYDFSKLVIKNLWDKYTEPFNMLKPIYTGPVTHQDTTVNGIRKTAFHLITPSMARVNSGSMYDRIHKQMLINDVDIIPLDSASKKATPSNIQDIYSENLVFGGEFASYLDKRFLKEQVKISNGEKKKIKNATQSTTIMLSNLMVDGYPKDLNPELIEQYNDALANNDFDTMRSLSPIYDKIYSYKEALEDVVRSHMEKIDALGIETVDDKAIERIKKLLLSNARQKHVEDGINQLGVTKFVDLVPNFNRIEPALFSLISNEVIRIKRPGELLAQYSVFGMDSTTIPGINTSKLKGYTPVYVNGELTSIKPAEAIIPATKSMIPVLLKMFNTENLQYAISKYNELSSESKFVVKSLRIPNQQLSFNSVFTIKEFAMPTMQNYIVTHSAIVPISSSDFDIDKQQVYIPVVDNDGIIDQENIYNKLLKSEIDLLLTPENFHHLIGPVNEAWFSKGVYSEITDLKGEYTKQELKNKETYNKSIIALEFKDLANISKQLSNAYNMTQSKINVGLVAVDTKQYPIGTVDRWEASESVLIGQNPLSNRFYIIDKNNENVVKNHYYATIDSNGRHVTEALSTLLTSQVDGVKNPYAPKLNITKQTLPIINLLVRRGVNVEIAIKIVNSPLVVKYTKLSLFYNSNLVRSKREVNSNNPKKRALAEVANTTYKKIQKNVFDRTGGRKEISENIIDNSFKSNSDAYTVLAFYTYLEKLASVQTNLNTTNTPDTKIITSRSELAVVRKNLIEQNQNSIIKNNPRNGFLKIFYDARNKYALLSNLYSFSNNTFSQVVNEIAIPLAFREYAEDKRTTALKKFTNDFKSFVFINSIIESEGSGFTFDNLIANNSLANEILEIQKDVNHELHDNYFIKNIEVLSNAGVDPKTNEKIDLLRLKNRGASPLHLFDIYDASSDISRDLIKKITAYNIYTSGFMYSPFSLEEGFTVNGLMNVIRMESISDKLKNPDVDSINNFVNLFPALNPYLFLKQQDEINEYADIQYDYTDSKLLSSMREVQVLGNNYVKRYDHAPNINVFRLSVSSKTQQPSTSIEQIYTQLGNKTQSENVVIKSWSDLKNAVKAITSQGIVSTRIKNSQEHFGNPFSPEPEGKTQGLIKTKNVKEAVEKYIDWVINSFNLDKKNLFTVTPRQTADKKAIIKASIATQYIGFGEGIVNSSTELYRQQAGNFANTGNYSYKDTIFVSIGGKRGTDQQQKEQQDKTIQEVLKAIETGATIITDNKEYTDASFYNTGEKRLYATLDAKGYKYSEKIIDGQLLGVWNKEGNRAEWIRNQLKTGSLKSKPVFYYKELGEPSHATALDYLINKYNWSKTTVSVKTNEAPDELTNQCKI